MAKGSLVSYELLKMSKCNGKMLQGLSLMSPYATKTQDPSLLKLK